MILYGIYKEEGDNISQVWEEVDRVFTSGDLISISRRFSTTVGRRDEFEELTIYGNGGQRIEIIHYDLVDERRTNDI